MSFLTNLYKWNVIRGQTNPDGSTSLVGAGGLLAYLGGNLATVGSRSAMYQTIASAIADIGSRMVVRRSRTETLTVTNGSATVTGSGTDWLPSGGNADNMGIGDLIRFDTDTRYYKIKSINSDTNLTLWEPYQGSTKSGVSVPYETYYFERFTLLLLPNDLAQNGITEAALAPGFDLVGLTPFGASLSENATSNAVSLSNFGENSIIGLRFAPTAEWGDLDKWISVNTTIWAGSDNLIANCLVENTDARRFHSGGVLGYPVVAAGKSTIRNTIMRSSRAPVPATGGAVTATAANTEVNFDTCRFELIPDAISYTTGVLLPGGLACTADATHNVHGCVIDLRDFGLTAASGNVSGIYVNPTSGTSNIVNVNNSTIRARNTTGSPAVGLEVAGPCTVNIAQSDVEGVGGANGFGVYMNSATATVNIRAGSRIKGSASQGGIANLAGTANVSGNADIIGGTLAVGTINSGTAT